jgi:hypothetical protein
MSSRSLGAGCVPKTLQVRGRTGKPKPVPGREIGPILWASERPGDHHFALIAFIRDPDGAYRSD